MTETEKKRGRCESDLPYPPLTAVRSPTSPMLQDLDGASPWRVLPPYFGPDSAAALGKYIKLLAFLKRPVADYGDRKKAGEIVEIAHNQKDGRQITPSRSPLKDLNVYSLRRRVIHH
jgi:hypothetical protein